MFDIRAYDVRGISSITDYLVVGTVRNDRQMQAAAQNLTRQLKKLGVRPLHADCEMQNIWIVLDYVDCIVHLFTPEARQYYALEDLWRGAEMPIKHLLAAAPAALNSPDASAD